MTMRGTACKLPSAFCTCWADPVAPPCKQDIRDVKDIRDIRQQAQEWIRPPGTIRIRPPGNYLGGYPDCALQKYSLQTYVNVFYVYWHVKTNIHTCCYLDIEGDQAIAGKHICKSDLLLVLVDAFVQQYIQHAHLCMKTRAD